MTARNHELTVKLSKDELEKIRAKSEQLGLKPSQYLRMIALHVKIDRFEE